MHVPTSASAADDAGEVIPRESIKTSESSDRAATSSKKKRRSSTNNKNRVVERRRQAAMNSTIQRGQLPHPVDMVVTSNAWRRFGESRRQELLVKDRMEGGTSFQISSSVAIERYFLLAERVSSLKKVAAREGSANNVLVSFLISPFDSFSGHGTVSVHVSGPKQVGGLVRDGPPSDCLFLTSTSTTPWLLFYGIGHYISSRQGFARAFLD